MSPPIGLEFKSGEPPQAPHIVHRLFDGTIYIGQAACKPGSVPLPAEAGRIGDHSSGTALADRLTRPTRMKRGVTPATVETMTLIPIRSCSGWGLPCRPCRQVRGALLPHPFTLTPENRGGLLSVALSLGFPRAGITCHPDTVEPGLSSSELPRQRSPGRLTRAGL